ncbi:putative efflux pump antibiotic resistance protein [Bisporella sp. PMI_857]|nr:putative efflux pump antibiotic resistance protein [Bisporella sp. PMI_857]
MAGKPEVDPRSTAGDGSTLATDKSDKSGSENEKQNGSEQGIQEGGAPDENFPRGIILGFLVLAIILSTFLISLDQTIISTAIPKITDEFHGLEKVSWYGSAYFMTFGGFQSSWGKAYKYFDLKLTFLFSIFMFEIGSLICGVAPNANALIAGRAIAGLGGAGMASGGFTIIALWCFYINLPIGAVTAAIILFFFKTPEEAKPGYATWKEKLLNMDPVGVVLAMCMIVCFFIALEKGGQTEKWSSSVVIGLLVGFIVILIALVIWEYYLDERAMIPKRIMRKRAIWAPSMYMFFIAGSYFILLYYLPIYFQSIGDTSPIGSGVRTLPTVITFSITAILAGAFVERTGIVTPTMLFGACLATVGCGLIYTLDIGTSSGKWIGYQILAAFGFIVPWLIPMNIVQANAEPQDISTVTAIIFLMQSVGGAFSISAAQSAFVNTMIKKLAETAPHINPRVVVATGATQIREAFPNDIDSILLGYMDGLKATFAISTGMIGFAALLSVLSPWKKLHGQSAAPMA